MRSVAGSDMRCFGVPSTTGAASSDIKAAVGHSGEDVHLGPILLVSKHNHR